MFHVYSMMHKIISYQPTQHFILLIVTQIVFCYILQVYNIEPIKRPSEILQKVWEYNYINI